MRFKCEKKEGERDFWRGRSEKSVGREKGEILAAGRNRKKERKNVGEEEKSVLE